MRKVERITKQCEVCHKDVLIFPRNINRFRFCSHSCKAKGVIAGWNKGKKMFSDKYGHPHTEETKRKISMIQQGITKSEDWMGYKRSQDYLERRKFKQTIQKLVFERDNYTCQLCGERGGDIQVDHIQSWAQFVEGRFDMNNCRTLCAKCHYQVTFNKPMPEGISGWGHNFFRKGGY